MRSDPARSTKVNFDTVVRLVEAFVAAVETTVEDSEVFCAVEARATSSLVRVTVKTA
jgi:hypothetical protein